MNTYLITTKAKPLQNSKNTMAYMQYHKAKTRKEAVENFTKATKFDGKVYAVKVA